jgi:hypothetical protein
MCLGATVSGYLGQALAQDYGYPFAFTALGLLSLIPFLLYVFFMPETLPEYERTQPKQKRRRLRELLRKLNEQRRRILRSDKNPFARRRRRQQEEQEQQHDANIDAATSAAAGPPSSSPMAMAGHHVELV